jgi:hypothetical protein
MDIAVIITIVLAAVGATWTLCWKLSGIESAFKEHAASDVAGFKALNDNVVQLKARTRKR